VKIAAAAAVEWTTVSGHRDGDIRFKRLLTGVEGTPANYELALVRMDGRYTTPRHRHNYDQIRVGLVGRLQYGATQYLRPGEIGYFPEGTYYGPQDITEQPTSMAIQFGGASGAGFMSFSQLHSAYQSLATQGEFHDGVFTRTTERGRSNQDGYEALWEHVMGRPLVYPGAMYEAPIIMRPAAFAARATAPGVARRLLGAFTARGTVLEQVDIDAGARWSVSASPHLRLGFVLDGAGRIAEQQYDAWSAFELAPNDTVHMSADQPTTLLVTTLPNS
jgi:quercetin dioxygenase-like cupin family protein